MRFQRCFESEPRALAQAGKRNENQRVFENRLRITVIDTHGNRITSGKELINALRRRNQSPESKLFPLSY